MTTLSREEGHNYEESRLWPSRYDERSGNPQVELIRPCEGLDERHDATKGDGAPLKLIVVLDDLLEHNHSLDRDTQNELSNGKSLVIKSISPKLLFLKLFSNMSEIVLKRS